MSMFIGLNLLMRELRHKAICFYHEFKRKRKKPKPFYLYFGGKRPFKIGEVLSSNGNGFKTISYGNAKIIEEFKQTKFRKFVDTHSRWKALFIKIGFKFRVYDYKCMPI